MKRVNFTNLKVFMQAHIFHQDQVIWRGWDEKKENRKLLIIERNPGKEKEFEILNNQKKLMIKGLCYNIKGRYLRLARKIWMSDIH